jgi:hypothetical protein
MATNGITQWYEQVRCPVNPGHVFRRKKFGQLWVELPSRALREFEWTWTSDLFISPHALEVLKENNVTGFETRPLMKAIFRKRSRGEPPPLFELAVTGWGGMGKSAGVELVEFCPSCRHRVYRIAEPSRLIDPSAWDGNDFFMVWPLPLFRFVSDRLAQIIRRNRLSGVKLTPAIEVAAKLSGGASPPPIDDIMPEARALELGEKFDLL